MPPLASGASPNIPASTSSRHSPLIGVLQRIVRQSRRATRRPVFSLGLLFLVLSTCSVYITVYFLSNRIAARDAAISRQMWFLDHSQLNPKFDESLDPNKNQSVVSFWAPDLATASYKSPRLAPSEKVAPPAPLKMFISLSKEEQTVMRWNYAMEEKELPYSGASSHMAAFPRGSVKWYNSLATFHGVGEVHRGVHQEHGWLGVTKDGRRVWNHDVPPPTVWNHPLGYEEAMKHGGFYLNLTNALPLDRAVYDNRGPVCSAVPFNYSELPDASVVITFYNEPFSTLMRTVHSVLNQTPPPILREIILVDDHSNNTLHAEMAAQYVKYLPKTKLMRLGERRGLVNARLAGARSARGEVLVILDSHVEVNAGWLEPQLQRISEQRNAIVFPQILSINPETFEYDTKSGIGCHISFRWSMQEQSSLAGAVTDPSPIPSPSMAGGLFAVDRDYFWFLGGYDNGFSMWGAENVEMGFRTWMCGGRLECTPCAMTYHIYRKKGHGYESPHEHIVRNRLRTARLWTDDYYSVAKVFITNMAKPDIGSLDEMIELKDKLKCKNFQWFLDNIDKEARDITTPDAIEYFSDVRNQHPRRRQYCLDTMSMSREGEKFGVFPCHGEGGTQSWVGLRERPYIVPVSNDRLCLSATLAFEKCKSQSPNLNFDVVPIKGNVVQLKAKSTKQCLSITVDGPAQLLFDECNALKLEQAWSFSPFAPGDEEQLIHTAAWLEKRRIFLNSSAPM